MAPPRDQLLKILLIARDNSSRGRGLSLRSLIEESDYLALRPRIEASQLVAALQSEPGIVADWLAYSEDKRTSLGWGFWRSRTGDWLVDGPGGVSERFASQVVACAEYVLRELDFWAAVGRDT